MRSRLIPVSDLRSVTSEPWVDRNRRTFVSLEGAYVPVRDGYPATHSLPERQREGRGYQKLGDVIAFHGRKPSSADIDEVMTRERPRGIIWIEGHGGVKRTPKTIVLAGDAGEVTHHESGLIYRLDVEQIMFSQGNRGEKRRVAGLVRPGERIGDMFAGIGYFTLSLARAGGIVDAMEINPVSFYYLLENTGLNQLTGRVHPFCGDCRDHISGIYDRIHMGHYDAVEFLPFALDHSRKGTCLHIHMLGDRTSEIRETLQYYGYDAELMLHRVKKAGPCLWHQVADVVIR